MSCYIVEDITINRILAFIETCNYSREGIYSSLTAPVRLDVADCNKAKQEYGAKLFEMNCDAYRLRYAESAHIQKDDLGEFTFELAGRPTAVQALKSLDCFLYQCSESVIPDTSTLFKSLESLRNDLCRAIVSHSDEYNAADWG